MKPSAFQKLATIWGRDVAFVLNVQASQRASEKRAAEIAQHEKLEREAEALRQAEAAKQSQAVKLRKKRLNPSSRLRSRLKRSSRWFKSLKPSGEKSKFNQHQIQKKSRGMRI